MNTDNRYIIKPVPKEIIRESENRINKAMKEFEPIYKSEMAMAIRQVFK